ncbi:MAG: apolipoprotein N-acyltransferase [Myxococcales bacterium]|nr:apolipoprotein N-acyltransferase [Myxococcales bacterium]
MTNGQAKGQWALAGGTGLLLAGAYPGLGWWPLALVAFVPLLWSLRHVDSVKRGFGLGLLAGTTLHGLSFHWLSFTMQEMSGLPTAVGWLVVGLHAVAMGLHQAVFAGMVVASGKWRQKWWWSAWLAAVWMAVELVVPWQFPWYLGNAVYPEPILLQAADIIGIVGVSGLCVAVASLSVVSMERRSWRVAATGIALIGVWVGYGSLRLHQVDAAQTKKKWTVGIVQHNPSVAEKKSLKPKPRLPMLHRAKALTKKLPLDTLDLVVWPEGTLPFFYVPLEVDKPERAPAVLRQTTKEVRTLAKGLGRPMVFGSLRMLDKKWKARPRNSAIVIDGTSEQTYDKRILVPFGEYLPGRDLFPSLKDLIPGVSDIGRGDGSSVLAIRGVKVGMSICYEALFPAFMWAQNATADVLLNLTDDVWFGPTNAPELHLMVQAPRAVELRRPLIRATATGVSALVDAGGRIRGRTGVWEATTRVVSVKMADLGSPYRLWGPWPGRLLGAWVLGIGFVLWRRRRTGLEAASPE